MKPTREELERWADPSDAKLWLTGEAAACLKRAARLALDLMNELERLTGVPVDGVVGNAPPPAPSPLLDDSIRQAVVDSADVLRSLAARDEDRHWHLRGDSFAAGLAEGIKYQLERGALSGALLDDALWRRVAAVAILAGVEYNTPVYACEAADALLAELRRREGQK